MKLIPLKKYPEIKICCIECNNKVTSKYGIFADIEGKAFRDYYCKKCVQLFYESKVDFSR